MSPADPTDHVDLDVANQVAAALGHLARPMRLAGPIAYLHRNTVEAPHVRRVEKLTWRDLPLVLARRVAPPPDRPWVMADPAGQLTAIRVDSDIVWAEAVMVTADPPGTRYPVGIDVSPPGLPAEPTRPGLALERHRATVVYRDVETGAELPDDVLLFSNRPTVGVFLTAELMGATIEDPPSLPAWPDAYLEVVGPCT